MGDQTLEKLSRGDITATYDHIRPHIRCTPVLDISGAPFGLSAPVTLKLECLQHTGSFKARGAFANLLTRDLPASGVVAASGGNHGAAVAYAAATLGIAARIFVPEISSPAKTDLIRSFGTDLVVTGALYCDALAASEAYRAKVGAISVHAYDARETLLGQGTLGLELAGQAADLDTVLVAVGGGGLIAGIAAWYGGSARIVAVEPETSCALHAALRAGRPVDVDVSGVAADSLGARRIGDLPFAICREHVADALLVSDDAITQAQSWSWRHLRLAVEPGGATALAALLSARYQPAPGERVGVVMCGSNVGLSALAALAASGES